MKNVKPFLLPAVCALVLFSCNKDGKDGNDPLAATTYELLSKSGVARMLASLPIEAEHIAEVWDAVNSSDANGYDEEYMLCDLLSSPGAGVGDSPQSRAATRAQYSKPLRDLIAGYLSEQAVAVSREGSTKASEAALVEQWLAELSSSGLQIYWPYSSDWDGETMPLVTFDPGYGATDNFAWEIAWEDGAYRAVRQVYVDESVAASRPVWVINSNDDSGFTPLQLFLDRGSAPAVRGHAIRVQSLHKGFHHAPQLRFLVRGRKRVLYPGGQRNGRLRRERSQSRQFQPGHHPADDRSQAQPEREGPPPGEGLPRGRSVLLCPGKRGWRGAAKGQSPGCPKTFRFSRNRKGARVFGIYRESPGRRPGKRKSR